MVLDRAKFGPRGGIFLEEQEIRALVAKNRTLETQLTKRNEQYVYDLRKALSLANLSESLQAQALANILPELVEGQKSGKTARQLFGTVTERARLILETPEPVKESGIFQMWLDNSLLLFIFLTLMAGVLPLFSKSVASGQQQGILTILVGAISGGYAFYLIYKYVYKFDRPGADQKGRPGGFKSILIMMGIMLIWMFVFMAAALIPPTINVALAPAVNVALAVLAFAIRYYLKKKYNIRGSMFSR